MSSKFFVVYSLVNKTVKPKIFKRLSSVENLINNDNTLLYEKFDSEERAQLFIEKRLNTKSSAARSNKDCIGVVNIKRQQPKTKEKVPKRTKSTQKKQAKAPAVSASINSHKQKIQPTITETIVAESLASSSSDQFRLEEELKKIQNMLSHDYVQPAKLQDREEQVLFKQKPKESNILNSILLQSAFAKNDNTQQKLAASNQPEPKTQAKNLFEAEESVLLSTHLRHFRIRHHSEQLAGDIDPNQIVFINVQSMVRQNPGMCSIDYTFLQDGLQLIKTQYHLGQKYKTEGQLLAVLYALYEAKLLRIRRLSVGVNDHYLSNVLQQRKKVLDQRVGDLLEAIRLLESRFEEVQYTDKQLMDSMELQLLDRLEVQSRKKYLELE